MIKEKSNLINSLISSAKEAGDLQLKYFRKFDELAPEEKSHQNFVTIVDKKSEELIMKHLQKDFPDYGFIGEESGMINPSATKKFIIDPLDGTVNFMKGLPFFCVSIALADFSKEKELLDISQIEAALIFAPVFNEVFHAEKNQGAFFNDTLINFDNSINKILCSIGNKNFQNHLLDKNFHSLLEEITHKRFFGAAALELAYVAIQRIDTFVHMSLNNWDMAAAALILKESGAQVFNHERNSEIFRTKSIIAY